MAIIGLSKPMYAIYDNLTVAATAGQSQGGGTQIEIDKEKLFTQLPRRVGKYVFIKENTEWKLNAAAVDLEDYGIDPDEVAEDDTIIVDVEEGTPTYRSGGVIAKAIEANIEIEAASDNELRADNGVAENDNQFNGGSIELGTDDLSQEVSKAILGIKEQMIEAIEGIDESVSELIFDDDQETPYLGIGVIIKKKHGGVIKWRAVVLTKVMFGVPADAAKTQGKEIEWQTPTLKGTIMRDDTAKHMWKREATFSTEENAVKYIKHRLNIV